MGNAAQRQGDQGGKLCDGNDPDDNALVRTGGKDRGAWPGNDWL